MLVFRVFKFRSNCLRAYADATRLLRHIQTYHFAVIDNYKVHKIHCSHDVPHILTHGTLI